MTNHPFRKMLLLTLLYLVIIVGIFAIQFRNETIISETFKSITLILSETKDENDNPFLKNEFKINFGGISLYSDEDNAAVIQGTNEPLVLSSWQKIDSKGFLLKFEQGIELQVVCSNGESSVPVMVKTVLPEEISGIFIPYKINSSYSPVEHSDSALHLLAKSGDFMFSAYSVNNYTLALNSLESTAFYSEYVEKLEFNYSDILDFELAQKEKYSESVAFVQSRIQNMLKETDIDTLSEKAVVAYVAEMSKKGRYTQTVSEIPASFKNNSKRTYLSAPFFNNLVNMNKTLAMQLESIAFRANYSQEHSDLSVFELSNFGLYLMSLSKARSNLILTQLAKDAELVQNATLRQSIGILKTYNYLQKYSAQRASVLKSAVDTVIENLQPNFVINGDTLQFNETVQDYTKLDVAELGLLFANYGKIINSEELCRVGYLLFNQIIAQCESSEYELFATLYELIDTENWYYPHLALLSDDTNPIWAWTCTEKVTYTETANSKREILTSFPQGDIHYMIIKGIKPFDTIEIYNMPYRTDYRFETYNSSGYVYDASSESLFLKYRHKSNIEPVVLGINPKVEVVPEVTTEIVAAEEIATE